MQISDIKNCPGTLAAGYNTYSPAALQRMFDNEKVSLLLDFRNDESQRVRIDANIRRASISGVQEKLSAIVENGKVRLAPEGLQGRYIIKPASDDKRLKNRNHTPANEHLTMQIARQVYGIQTAENALIFFQDSGKPAYITKRFDVAPDGHTKIKQEDFASLMQKTSETHGTYFKYAGSYADMKILFQKYVVACEVETVRFFRLILFNYLFANGDAHLKNFSLQETENHHYILSPAYDLLNTSLHIADDDFALEGGLFAKEFYSDTYLRKGHPCREDFVTFGKITGIPDVQIPAIMQDFLAPQPLVYDLIKRSFLSETLKRMYIRTYEERLNRLKRS